ncbi:hypothetical protein GCM10009557_02860 [Virgisporangium ochraceum]|uniref:DUF8175 domain-containing protein n=1 Tax=Virgisporangium ochraceum TaxID=65505 RepID=A0A8J3ZQA5_9ACTN|nr:hypothetical protein [Virgisporangium ochraceum]GIJ67949.1 hypothetical protein Voc01_028660 [Virgisporangium ochraceum]
MKAGRHRKRNRTGTIIVLAAITVAMVAGTIAVACLSRNQEPEPPKRNPTTAKAEPAPDPEQEHEQEPEATAFTWPTDLTWERVAGIDLPASKEHGPRNRNLGRSAAFAQSPPGAVLAALHLIVRTSYQAGPAVWEPTLRDQVVGPDAVAYAEEVRADHRAALRRGDKADRIYAAIAGIRLDSYRPEAASMRVLIEAPTGTGTARAAALVQVAWSDNDWRLVAPPHGDWSTVRTPVPADAVSDYIPLPAR